MNRDLEDAYGGFNDLKSFREELGADVAGISDADALRIIDENLQQKTRLSAPQREHLDLLDVEHKGEYKDTVFEDMNKNLRAQAQAEARERRKLQAELASERQKHSSNDENMALKISQRKLLDELESEKMKRLFGDRFVWKSPGTLEDYLTKERLKRELKEELADEKRRAADAKKLAKLWASESKPKKKSPARKPKKSPARKPKKSPARKKK